MEEVILPENTLRLLCPIVNGLAFLYFIYIFIFFHQVPCCSTHDAIV